MISSIVEWYVDIDGNSHASHTIFIKVFDASSTISGINDALKIHFVASEGISGFCTQVEGTTLSAPGINRPHADNVFYSLPTADILEYAPHGNSPIEVMIQFQHNTLVSASSRGDKYISPSAAFIPRLHGTQGSFVLSFPRAENAVKRFVLRVLSSVQRHKDRTLCDQYEFRAIDNNWRDLSCDQRVRVRYEFGEGFPRITLHYKVLSLFDISVAMIRFVWEWGKRLFLGGSD